MEYAFPIVMLVSVGAIALYAITAYNGLVRARQMVREAWSGIDVQLKRRANLIPNLVETVKGHAGHEATTLQQVVEARRLAEAAPADNVEQRAAAEGALGSALGRLLAVSEDYPDLRASENFRALQASLEKTEADIQMARRYYNGTARDLNTRIESFPSNMIAGQFGFGPAGYFEIANMADREVPEVDFSQRG